MPYLLSLVVLGGAGVYAWRNLADPAPPAATKAAQELDQSASSGTHVYPTRLDFLVDTGLPYQVRIARLRSTLDTDCTEPELRFLYQLLEKAPPKGELPEHWFVIANDIMTSILRYETDPRRFSSNFIALLDDPGQAEVIRDYAVQYLAAWLNPRSAQATTDSLAPPTPEIAAQVLQALADATTDPALEQSSIPGTTLMMLVDLTRSGSGVDCSQAVARLKPWLAQALKDGSTLSNPIRVSAVSAAGILAPDTFRPMIREIAYQENAGSSLRLPAIAALGQAGDAGDLPKLRQIASNSPEFTYAAQDAAASLAARLAPSSPSSISK